MYARASGSASTRVRLGAMETNVKTVFHARTHPLGPRSLIYTTPAGMRQIGASSTR
jgi:hypothetical protein